MYQTWYPVAPGTGVQRIRSGSARSRLGTLSQRMLKPNGALHPVAPPLVIARTCAYSAYGDPVNHGSATSTATAGTRIGAIVDEASGSVCVLDELDELEELEELDVLEVEV